MYSEFNEGTEQDTLKLYFMNHEVALTGHGLRRVESAMLSKDLAWIKAGKERHRPVAEERGLLPASSFGFWRRTK